MGPGMFDDFLKILYAAFVVVAILAAVVGFFVEKVLQ